MRWLRPVLVMVPLLLMSGAAGAGVTCHGKWLNPVTDVCWRCLFPMVIGGVYTEAPGSGWPLSDPGEPPPPVCACPLPSPPYIRPGIGLSYWEPARSVDVVRSPFCSPTLGGVELGSLSGVKTGDNFRGTDDEDNNFYHVHFFIYPLLNWMGMLNSVACTKAETTDVLMMSEFEPTWGDDELAMLLTPEATLFTNPVVQAACAADCVSSTAGYPLDLLHWCVGCQGSMYPMSGNITGTEGGIDNSLLALVRMHAKMARVLISQDTGSITSMCAPMPMPVIRKSLYRTQMAYPIPQPTSAFPYGASAVPWQMGHSFPAGGEDFAYLVFRKDMCCAF